MSPRLRQYVLYVAVAFGLGGCANFQTTKPQGNAPFGAQKAKQSSSASTGNEEASSTHDLSLSTIINRDLQAGRYAEGEPELRHYLQRHPNDPTAQSLLAQLTAEPAKMLGPAGHTHVVQAGESYSTLAAQYLGDASLFLILARYNNATNPSLLRAGVTIQLPAAVAKTSRFAGAEGSAVSATPEAGNTVGSTSSAPANESPTQKALRLQAQSTSEYQQGNKSLALSLLDQALTLDPTLKPAGPESEALRKELVVDYHQRAIVLYRDQHLDEAIALWDRVLAVDPNFEPAAIYRARALELKQRLKQY